MKRPSKKQDNEKGTKLEQFSKLLFEGLNGGIHQQLKESQDYLDKHELQSYIDEERGLNITKIENNEDLTVEHVIEIATHYANYSFHRNWHEAIDYAAEQVGIDTSKLTGGNAKVEIVGADNLPPEVIKALKKIADNL